MALSSCVVEYVAGSSAACQANWLHNVLEDLMIKLKQPVKQLIDNKSAINLAKNPHCLWEVETHRNQIPIPKRQGE